jgi:hypothetical protein
VGRAGEAVSRWDGAAAAIPDLVMQSLGLEAPPDLDAPPFHIPGWNTHGVTRLLAAIENRFGVSLDATTVGGALSLADLAAAVERARGARR